MRVRWRGHWIDLPAFKPPQFVDGAGSGDWTSAGLIYLLGATRAKIFATLKKSRLLPALQFGQELAAINCGYEGARGAMMAMTRDQLSKRLIALSGRAMRHAPDFQDAPVVDAPLLGDDIHSGLS